MGNPDTTGATLRPLSTLSMGESAASTLEPSAVPSVLDKPIDRDPEKEETPRANPSPENEQSAGEAPAELEKDLKVEAVPEEDAAETSSSEEPTPEYPAGWKLGLISIALCLSVLCMALDNTIIAVAIPKITDQFHSLDDVGWYASAYLLTTCAFQLIYGKMYTFYSLKWIYLMALFIFEVGSVICAWAPNSVAFIVGRAVAGLGAAGVFSGAILIVAHTVPLERRPAYTGIIGAMYGIASVAGPLLGGVFTDSKLTWRACFWINIPCGFITAVFIIFFFTSPQRTGKQKKKPFREQITQFDLPGTAVFIPGIVCILLALQWGGTKYPWKSARVIALFVLGGLLNAAFVAIQFWKGETATVPPRIFKNRNVWGSAWFGASLGAAFFVMIYYIPIWFQAIKGVSAVKSGIMNLPMVLSLVLLSVISGGLVTTIGYYTPFMIASSIIMTIGAGLLTTFHTNTGHAMWIGYQVLFGAGVGLGMQQILIAVQASIPLADVPVGTAIMMFSQTIGGSIFASVAQNVFNNQLVANLKTAVPDFPSGQILAVGATQLKHTVPSKYLPQVLSAYNRSLTETWYVSVAMGAISIFGAAVIEWRSVKGKKIEMAAA